MKITEIDTYVLNQNLSQKDAFTYSQNRYNTRTILICRVATDDGIEGWGEAFGPAKIHQATIQEIYKPLVIGNDPFDTEVIWQKLYNTLRDHGQKGLSVEAISAIDIALWDIKAKAAARPLYKLLGGAFRERVIPYATGLYRSESEGERQKLINEVENYLNAGFKAIKVKIGFGLEYDVDIVKTIRDTFGYSYKMMVDPNHAYNASTAIAVGRELEPYAISWLEEPVPPEDIEGYKEVRRALTIPIAGGEAEFTRFGFSRLLSSRAVDIVQPDCCVTGGISEFIKIVSLATIHNIQCLPHIWGSGIALQTGIHLAFALPDFPPALYPAPVMLEMDGSPNIFREKLNKVPVVMEEGFIEKPAGIGLGFVPDWDIIEQYRI